MRESRLVIGIKLSDERHTAVLTDFAGTILAEATLATTPVRKSLDQMLDETGDLIRAVLGDRPLTAVTAVGIGAVGAGRP